MAIGIPNVLSLLGGIPHLPSASVFMDKIAGAKALIGGDISSILNSVLTSGNLSSLMQNPIASITSTLQSTLTSSVSSLESALGSAAAPLVSAMTGTGGLSSIATTLTGTASSLAGLSSGSFGPLDLLNQSNMVNSFFGNGSQPTAISLATAAAPLTSTSLLSGINTDIGSITSAVIAGTMSVSDGTTAVEAHTTNLTNINTNSGNAFTTMQNNLVNFANISALGAATIGSSSDMQNIISLIVQPTTLTQLQAAATAAITPD